MYGSPRDPEYDDHCESCGAGYYFEVGLHLTCTVCGGPLQVSEPYVETAEDRKDDDVVFDPRYIGFDSIKAFRIIRDLGKLDECQVDAFS